MYFSIMDQTLSTADMLCYALYSANHALNRTYRGLLDPLGLTYPQYLVLVVLWGAEGDLALKDIGAQTQLDSGTLTPLLKRMEAAGLLTRRRNPQDERGTLIALTEAGQALRARAAHIPHKIIAAMGGEIDALIRLREGVTALRDRLEAQNKA